MKASTSDLSPARTYVASPALCGMREPSSAKEAADGAMTSAARMKEKGACMPARAAAGAIST